MTNDQFMQILEARLNAIRDLCTIKGQEYGKDVMIRLCQFKKIAERQNITPEKALRVLVTKHLTAIDDHIDRISEGEVAPLEKWDEWLGDEILYAILLEGLIVERLVGDCDGEEDNRPEDIKRKHLAYLYGEENIR